MTKHIKGSKANTKARREPDEETLSEFKEAFKIFDSKNTGKYILN
jgi:Ca2+-binding EF-hand superfamily protein